MKIINKITAVITIMSFLFVNTFGGVSFAQSPSNSESSSVSEASDSGQSAAGTGQSDNAGDLSSSNSQNAPAESTEKTPPANSPDSPQVILSTSKVPYVATDKFQVEPQTGIATLNIPLDVVSGRRGIQPSLFYNSSGPNDWLGVGWSLELGSIQRSTKKGVPTYDNNIDTFVLTQQGSSQELISIGNNEYRPKIEGAFMKFVFSGGCWVVTDKKGTKYYFGETDDDRQADPNNSSQVFKWCLNKVEDLYGNRMQILYTHDQSQIYPQYIRYIYNSDIQSDYHAEIEFVLETRPDAFNSYRSRFLVTTAKRLQKILVKAENNLQRSYGLNYGNYSSSTHRSILRSIKQFASDGITALPETSFSYTEFPSSYPWVVSNWNIPTTMNFDAGTRIVDVSGNGFPDLLRYYYNGGSTFSYTYLNSTNGWAPSTGPWFPLPDSRTFYYWPPSGPHDNGIRFADINSDGFQDMLAYKVHRGSPWGNGVDYNSSYINNKTTAWIINSVWTLPTEAYIGMLCGNNYSDWGDAGGAFFEDVNADGKTDIVIARPANNDPNCSREECHHVWLNNGAGWTLADYQPPSDVDFSGNQPNYCLVDVNADGLPDIVYAKRYTTHKTYLNTGHGWVDNPAYALPQSADLTDGTAVLADINSDGFVDIEIIDGSTRKCYLNYCGTWVEDNTYAIPTGQFNDSTTRLFDANNDGLVDVARYDSQRYVALNTGAIPDLICSVSNNVGSTTTIQYKPSSAYDNTGTDGLCHLPFPVQTVYKVTVTDQLQGQSYITTYDYKGGLFDFGEREFRGFAWVKIIDPLGNYAETEFLQDDLYKGRTKEARSYDSQGNLYTKATNTWGSQNLYPNVDFVYLSKSDNYVFDGNASGRRTQAQYFYEENPQYGDPTKTIELGEVDLVTGDDIGQDKRISFTEYTHNPNIWLLGFAKSSYMQDANNSILKQAWFYYDGHSSINDPPTQGALTKQEAWLSGGVNPLTQFSYDVYGDLLTTTDSLNHTAGVEYDSNYHIFPVRSTNPLGHQSKTIYYGVNDNQTQGEFIDPYLNQGSGLWGQVKVNIDPNNNAALSIYDGFGRLINAVSPFDSIGYPTKIIDYDLSSVPTKMITHQREVSGESGTLDGVSFYDGLGRLIETKSESEEPGKFVVAGQVKFNSRGLPEKNYLPFFDTTSGFLDYVPVSQNPFNYSTITYDPLARVVETTNPDSTFANAIYDDWELTGIDENGHMQKSYSDAYGRLIKKEEYSGSDGRSPYYPNIAYTLYSTTLYSYDLVGNLIQTQDNAGNTASISYDTLGRKISMNDPDMGSWHYYYDAVGNLIKQTDAKNQILCFKYDALNRLVSKSAPQQTTDLKDLSENSGGGGGISASQTLATYIYDSTQSQNSKGRLVQASYLSSDFTKFYYDTLGREIKSEKKIDGVLYSVQRSYDAANRLASLEYPDGEAFFYAYNPSGAVSSVGTQSMPYAENIHYTASGQIKKIEYGNNTKTYYHYNLSTLRLDHLKTFSPQANPDEDPDGWALAQGDIQDLQYTFDSVGNILIIHDSINSASSQTFVYDELNRLTSATNSIYGQENYSYNEIGNLLYKGGLYLSYSSTRPHAVTGLSDGTVFGYDENGNMISETSALGALKNFQYDIENRLTTVKKNGTKIAAFSYDGDGGRTKKSIYTGGATDESSIALRQKSFDKKKTGIDFLDGVCTLANRIAKYASSWAGIQSAYAGTPPTTTYCLVTTYVGSLFEKVNNLKTKHIFLGSQRICTISKNTVSGATNLSYFHSNHLGSTDKITDTNGTVVTHYEYSPYGSTVMLEGQDTTAYKFTGKPLDDETGLYYYGARYYNPFIGRFITPDSIVQSPENPQTLNRYTYCNNNPVNLVDPTGNSWWSKFWKPIVAIAVGIVVGVFTAGIGTAFYAGLLGSFWGGIASAATTGAIAGAFAGATGAGLNGQDILQGTLMGAGYGALSGAVFGGINNLEGKTWNWKAGLAKVALAGVAGGGISELTGGSFADGAMFAGAVAGSDFVYRAILSTQGKNQGPTMKTARESGQPKLDATGNPLTVDGKPVVLNNPKESNVGFASKVGDHGIVNNVAGETGPVMGSLGRFVPGFQGLSLAHDITGNFFSNILGSTANTLTFNFPTMPIIYGINAAGSLINDYPWMMGSYYKTYQDSR